MGPLLLTVPIVRLADALVESSVRDRLDGTAERWFAT
jgi:hypothetical protein